MNLTISPSLLNVQEEKPTILSAYIKDKSTIPIWEKWRKNEDNHFEVFEPRVENQRLYFSKWSKPYLPRDPHHFTEITKKLPWKNQFLDEGWQWVDDWAPKVIDEVTDQDGWVYGRSFVGWNSKKPRKRFFDTTRSRFVTRRRISTFKSSNTTCFDTNVKPKGSRLIDCIQYGIKISLLKDKKSFDSKTRIYFFLADKKGNAYQFQDYAPKTFLRIRELFGVDETKYTNIICNRDLLGGEKNVAGKSGQIFWRSFNQEFILKTVTQEEASFLQNGLETYFEHLSECPHTLISRFFGLHKVKIGNTRLRFVVMNNVFSTCKVSPQLIYDLKGTTEDRFVKHSSKLKTQPILKDLNFSDRYVLVSKAMSNAILTQIRRDVEFLTKWCVMDYSLLLGVCVGEESKREYSILEDEIDLSGPLKKVENGDSLNFISKASLFENGVKGALGETYFFGVIDFLQDWTKKKKAANAFKTVAFCDCSQNKIDSVPPQKYGQRFLQYINTKVKNATSLGSVSMGLDEIQNRILVNCNSALDLKIAESITFSSCNPYVLIQYGERQSVTSIIKRNKNPVWGHFCSFPLPLEGAPKYLKFTVLNSDFGFPPSVIGIGVLFTCDAIEKKLKTLTLPLLSEKDASQLLFPRRSSKRFGSRVESQDLRGYLVISVEKIEFQVTERLCEEYLATSSD